mmetsp:Transcript_113023/g.319769  ORF Transcript_113023/g.319769 Transcript_113023/m.319769 type:complete len:575 (-) Transcript_113023:130-1854(-)
MVDGDDVSELALERPPDVPPRSADEQTASRVEEHGAAEHGKPEGRPRLSDDSDSATPNASASPEVYLEALRLDTKNTSGPLRSIRLPLASVPHLSKKKCTRLKRWADALQRTSLPNGLRDSQAANLDRAPIDIASLSSMGRALVEYAVLHLRQRMEEANVSRIRGGKCGREAQKAVLRIDLGDLQGGEARAMETFGVGLECLCRAVAKRDAVLGQDGGKWLRQARRALREWFLEFGGDVAPYDPHEALAQVDKRLPHELGGVRRDRLCVMAVASHQAVRADLARDMFGYRGEAILQSSLEAAGLERDAYHLEEDLRSIQNGLFGSQVHTTPDVLLRRPLLVNGDTPVRWIDSKGSCPLPGFVFRQQLEKLQCQLSKFVRLYGQGLVVWQTGFAYAPTAGLEGVHVASWASDRTEDVTNWPRAEALTSAAAVEALIRRQSGSCGLGAERDGAAGAWRDIASRQQCSQSPQSRTSLNSFRRSGTCHRPAFLAALLVAGRSFLVERGERFPCGRSARSRRSRGPLKLARSVGSTSSAGFPGCLLGCGTRLPRGGSRDPAAGAWAGAWGGISPRTALL